VYVTLLEAHSVPHGITDGIIFHPIQVKVLHLNPSQTGRYSICLPQSDGRL